MTKFLGVRRARGEKLLAVRAGRRINLFLNTQVRLNWQNFIVIPSPRRTWLVAVTFGTAPLRTGMQVVFVMWDILPSQVV